MINSFSYLTNDCLEIIMELQIIIKKNRVVLVGTGNIVAESIKSPRKIFI